MNINIVTLFPEIFNALNYGILGKAVKNNIINPKIWDLKKFARKSERLDDSPYGGGAGMIIKYQPLSDCIKKIKQSSDKNSKVFYLSPRGIPLDQELAHNISQEKNIIIISGRYEGIDERVVTKFVNKEISLGDYILSNGDYAAISLIDCITRLLPNTLGNKLSIENESFSNNLLDYPHYTRPRIIDNMTVPDVLVEGNHLKIKTWQEKQSIGTTWLNRKDLFAKLTLDDKQKNLLREFIKENFNDE